MTKIYSGAPQMAQICGTRERKVVLSKKAVKKMLTTDIYDSWQSAVRELYANGVAAVKKAVQAGEITADEGLVTIQVDGSDLSITDNGTGISAGAFHEALRVYGSTTNDDRTVPGMFGTGFFSYRLLGRRCTIESMTRDGHGFRASCTDATEFDILEGMPARPGTRITVHMDTEVMSDKNSKIVWYAMNKLAEYSDVAVCIKDGSHYSGRHEARSLRDVVAGWQRRHPEAFYHEVPGVLEIAANPHVELYDDHPCLLAGVPIKGVITCLNFKAVFKMADESVFVPGVSRDELSPAGQRALKEWAVPVIGRELQKGAEIGSYPEYARSPHKAKFREVASYARDHGGTRRRGAYILNKGLFGLSPAAPAGDIVRLLYRHFKLGWRSITLLDAFDLEGLVYCGCRKKHALEGRTVIRPAPEYRDRARDTVARWKVPTCGGKWV